MSRLHRATRRAIEWTRHPLARLEQKIRGALEDRGYIDPKIALGMAQLRMSACIQPDPLGPIEDETKFTPLAVDSSYRHYPPPPEEDRERWGAYGYNVVMFPPGVPRVGSRGGSGGDATQAFLDALQDEIEAEEGEE